MSNEVTDQAPAVIADAARNVVAQAVAPAAGPKATAKLKFEAAPVETPTPLPRTVATSVMPATVSPPSPFPQLNKEHAMSTTEEIMTFGQANVEAVIKSGQIWTSGVQDLGRTIAESAQAQFDHTVATWKALAGLKSLKEVVEIQTTHGRTAMEKVVADTGRLTDASMKLAEQAMAPLTARLSLATERFGRTG